MFRALVLTIATGLALFIEPAVQAAEPWQDDTPRIAVMSAYTPEWQALLAATQNQQDHVLNGKHFITGRLEGKNVLLLLSGISMVNAAMSTQMALDHFHVTSIVFSGIAGGADPALSIGDVVIAAQWGEYLESVFARETKGKFAPPKFDFIKIPYKNFGMMFPIETEVTRNGQEQPESRFWFPADERLLAVARDVAAKVSLERCADERQCLTQTPKIVVGGNGVSGQSFIDNAAFRAYAFKTFKAEVLDMESAAVAHVAFANGVPFIAFRSLSDLAGGDKTNQLGIFFKMASTNSAKVVMAFLDALPVPAASPAP